MTSPPSFIPVGLDISSIYSRIAVDGRQGVVSNTQGDRFTLALVAREASGDYVVGEAGLRLDGHVALIDNNDLDHDEKDDLAACQAFLQYMIQLAADNAAVSVDQLRLVVACPSLMTREGSGGNNTKKDWIERVNQACRSLIVDKKKRKEDCVVGVMTKAAATCVAHQQHHQHDDILVEDGTILVVDMDGDSSLQLSVMAVTGGVYSEVSTVYVDGVSGPELLKILSTHVATHFERQNRLQRGEVMESKKAKTKLLKEAQRVLLSGGNTMTFMLDGLYEGLDCNVNISKPRWELMTAALVAKVEAALTAIEVQIDSVLLSGAWATLFVKHSIEKIFADKLKMSSLAAEEAVVLGCAKQAGLILAKPGLAVKTCTVEVPVSPVTIGVGDGVVLIPKGSPLPFKISHIVTGPTKVYQLAAVDEKIELAELTDVIEETTMTLELSLGGQLSIGFLGQPLVVI